MNNHGLITIDYLFTFFLVMGFAMVLLTFSASLSMVEVVQYMTYASARKYFAANVTEQQQKVAAAAKYSELRNSPVVAPLLSGGWFQIDESNLVIDYNIPGKYPQFQGYTPTDPTRNLFHGVVLYFTAKVLDFRIPFYGSTASNDPNKSTGFGTFIGSYLGREPSHQECADFVRNRYRFIRQLPNSAGAAAYSQASNANQYVPLTDNGC